MPRWLHKKAKVPKEVEYEELKKNEAYHIKIKGADIVAFRLQEYEQMEAKGEAGITPVKVSGGYWREKYGKWNIVVETEKFGLLPYESWKEEASKTLSRATASQINPEDIQVSGSIPVKTPETFRFMETEELKILTCEFKGESGSDNNHITVTFKNTGTMRIHIDEIGVNDRFFEMLELAGADPGEVATIQFPPTKWISGRNYEIVLISRRRNKFPYVTLAP